MKNSIPSISITTNGLSKRFNHEWIFRHLDFEFRSGKKYAITGPNGSGKSTLLQILWGQVPSTSGTVTYNTERGKVSIEDIHQHVAIATPYMDLIEDFTLREMLEFHFKLRHIRSGMSIDDLLEILYLRESAEKYIRNFSSGMRQRLKLGLAFFTEASIVFLDEPGSHLDSAAFDWYLKQLKTLPAETLLLIGSNDQKEFESADAILLDIRQYKGSKYPLNG